MALHDVALAGGMQVTSISKTQGGSPGAGVCGGTGGGVSCPPTVEPVSGCSGGVGLGVGGGVEASLGA